MKEVRPHNLPPQTTPFVGRQAELAVELLAFALQHPSSSQEAKDRAAPLLTELEGRLSPEAVAAAKERGQARDLQTIIDWWLAV